MEWYIKVLKQYANFSGRARRKEFWMFVLFNMIFVIGTMIFDNMWGLTFKHSFGWLQLIYCLAVAVPSLAVCVRRAHDIGKSGLWNIIALIPLVGAILLIFWYSADSQAGENKWGANPKE